MRPSALAENRVAASVHAILDDALFTILGCRFRISAAADQSGKAERQSATVSIADAGAFLARDILRSIDGCSIRLQNTDQFPD
jgi:hypothetical protein